MNIPASIIQSARLLEGRAGSEETMMGSSRRGGGAVFGDPFAIGTGGTCRENVGMVNWGPGGRSGGARTSVGTLIPSARRAGLGRARVDVRARLYMGATYSRALFKNNSKK